MRIHLGGMLFAAVTGLLAAPQAHAAMLVSEFDFEGSAYVSKDAHPSATGNWVMGDSSLSGGTLLRSRNSSQVVIQRSTYLAGADSEASAVASNVYWSFTVTPTAALTLSRLDFETLWYNADPVGTIFLRTSAGGDAFATTLGSFPVTSNNQTPVSVDLTASSVNFANVTGPVEFRFYLYAQDHTNAGETHGVDNVRLYAIPEPATALLLLIGAAAGMRRRRR